MRLKKAFAVILAIAMVFGAVSLASAKVITGGFADAAENKQANQIAYLKAIGVAKGDENGNYNPDAALTRQEFVTFVARLAGQEAAAEFMAGIPSRYLDDEDIADWARGPVNLADTNGWVQGYDDGKFHPTDTLTYAQAVTVLIRVLGHEAVVSGPWPNAHIVKGINLGLNAGVSLSANTPISRADMGRLLYNSLFIDQLEQTGDNKWDKAPSLMAGRTVKGKVTAASASSITLAVTDPADKDKASTVRGLASDVTLVGASTISSLLNQNVRITTSDISDGTAKVTIVEVLGTLTTGSAVAFKKLDTVNNADTGWKTVHYIVFSDDSKVEYDPADTTYAVNGSMTLTPGQKFVIDDTTDPVTIGAAAPSLDDLTKATHGLLAANDWVIVTESDGVATHVEITHFDHNDALATKDGIAKSKTAASDVNRVDTDTAGTIELSGANITVNGESASVTDIKKNDALNIAVVQVYDRDGAFTPKTGDDSGKEVAFRAVVTRNVVEGTIDSSRVTYGSGAASYATIKLADGSTKEYKWNTTKAGAIPGKGIKVNLVLSASGVVLKNLGIESSLKTAAYKVLSGGFDGANYTVTVDHKGQKVTLAVESSTIFTDIDRNSGGASDAGKGWGKIQYLTIDTTSGQVSGTAEVTFAGMATYDPTDETDYDGLDEVRSAGTVVVYFDGTDLKDTVENPATYELSGDTTATLGVGDWTALETGDKVLVGSVTGVSKPVALLLASDPS